MLEQRGAAAVETAILATLLLVLVFGVIDIGRAIFTRIAIEDAVQDGATYASITETADIASIEARVRNAISEPDLSATPITVTCTEDTTGSRTSRFVEVSVRYAQPLITPVASSLAGPLNLTASASVERFAPGQPCP